MLCREEVSQGTRAITSKYCVSVAVRVSSIASFYAKACNSVVAELAHKKTQQHASNQTSEHFNAIDVITAVVKS